MATIELDSILPDIETLIENDSRGALLNILLDMHPADIEEVLNHLRKEERVYLFGLLPTELASQVLTELDTPIVEQVLEDSDEQKISELVDFMESDDAADFVANLNEEVADKVLKQMPKKDSREVIQLLTHEEDTAGGIMALEFIAMPTTATVNETIEKIREMRDDSEEVYNIFVVDDHGKLLGSVSLTDLVLAKGYVTLREIMEVDVHSVAVDIDQEEVANMFRKYDLVSLAVVDLQNRPVGRITIDDIIDVMEEEGAEDLSYVAGAPDEEILEESSFIVSKARIPWLLVSFFGNILAAFILEAFDATLERFIASAFFFPLIMAMGGSTGQQASVIVVRGLATGDIFLSDTRYRLIREFRISLLTSIFFATLVFGVIYFWQGVLFAAILSLTMFMVINAAAIMGTAIPLIFKKLNIDPALATAPFIATTNDVFGLLIYLAVLTSFLGIFG
ncbi:MAG: magnesium transporter [Caldithrix sp.]|nr:magnesium transporter [Caldithrix sp.]